MVNAYVSFVENDPYFISEMSDDSYTDDEILDEEEIEKEIKE